MTITALPLFNAESQAFWLVDDTAMTLVSAADLPPGKVRQNMRDDLAKSGRLEVRLLCVHFSDSFLGISGTHVHGRGWKLHRPQGSDDLWEQAERASRCDWTETAAHSRSTMQPTDERQPTEDEAMGMAWWNSLSEESRAKWAACAGTGVVADAWAAFKADVNAKTEQP